MKKEIRHEHKNNERATAKKKKEKNFPKNFQVMENNK